MKSSRDCERNVAREYMLGVRIGSTPRRARRKRGVEADIKVGTMEWRMVTGAMENGRVQDGRDCNVGRRDLGGCIEDVSISFVRAISSGANRIPAIPAAPTAATKLAIGNGEERMSRPPMTEGIGIRYGGCDCGKETPGSGRARTAQSRDRAKDVIVLRRMEWIKVLLVPFHIPHAPSVVQR